MSINGVGGPAVEWGALLEYFTSRSDLHQLTLHHWLSALQSHILLKKYPAWCPTCYAEWCEERLPIYQPLLWMLKVVSICTKHRRWLETRCPQCQKNQSVIAIRTLAGHCTQCNSWLGTASDLPSVQVIDEETIAWQEWVVSALTEIRAVSASSKGLQWERFFPSFAECMKERGAYTKLARLTGFNRLSLYHWVGGKYVPSLELLLEFCYVCHVTPIQVMTKQLASFRQVIQSGTSTRSAQPRRSLQPIDRARCMQLIQDVLDGREKPLGILQLARRLGHEAAPIKYHFPKECALVTELARKYREQRKEQRVTSICEEMRQIVIRLHSQGVFPSWRKVENELTNPQVLLMPEVRNAWHAARRELGIEQ